MIRRRAQGHFPWCLSLPPPLALCLRLLPRWNARLLSRHWSSSSSSSCGFLRKFVRASPPPLLVISELPTVPFPLLSRRRFFLPSFFPRRHLFRHRCARPYAAVGLSLLLDSSCRHPPEAPPRPLLFSHLPHGQRPLPPLSGQAARPPPHVAPLLPNPRR